MGDNDPICAECGDPIVRDREYHEITAEIQPNGYEKDRYYMHGECWYKVSRTWTDPSD